MMPEIDTVQSLGAMVVFDIVTALGVLVSAGAALFARDRIACVAAFMVMGLLVALSWVRLDAPDVALAEAAIGAGLTGALLLRSARRLGPMAVRHVPRMTHAVAATGSVALAAGLAWAVISAGSSALYPALVSADLAASGVSNPVTAVLLNFRAWDTLLEVAVLVAALLVVAHLSPARIDPAPLGELVLPFARIAVPASVFLAGHLLWRGSSAPGGAFQAAAVLAGGGIALALAGVLRVGPRTALTLRLAGLCGLAVFLGAALATVPLTGGFLHYPQAAAKIWIVAIEAALTLSIAATLVLLFLGSPRRVS